MDLPARVDNMFFNALLDKNIIVYGTSNGLIDHCTFVLTNAPAVYANADGYGDISWATPVNYGTSNALYIEDCLFTNVVSYSASSVANDASSGAREVFRHNVVLNTSFQNHGTETSERYRSQRSFEIYDNLFIESQGYSTPLFLRGGTGVIFSNTVIGYDHFCGLNNYRSIQSFDVWGGANGTNTWDSNNPTVFATMTHTGGNNSPTFMTTGANWTINQWVGYTIDNLDTGEFSIITSNSEDTIYTGLGRDYYMSYNYGDVCQIYHVDRALDQIGLGSGDLLGNIELNSPPWNQAYNTVTGSNTWPHEVSEPLYAWGNTWNGSPMPIYSDYPSIVDGLDYTNIPKPNYTPFMYPHPLTGGTNGGPSDITNGIVGWWKFDEESGTEAYDSSGNENDGILSISAQWSNGALSFNGSDSYVVCGTNNVPTTFPITISYWENFNSGGGGGVISRMQWSDWVNWRCDDSAASMNVGGGIIATLSFGWATNIADGNWHFVTIRVSDNGDGTGTAKIYADGVNYDTETSGYSGGTSAGTPTIIIGARQDYSYPFNGLIDDVRIYNRALSDSEISTLLSNGRR